MNWFVHKVNDTVREEYDHCEHLSVGDIAPHVVGEQDSFGPVERYAMCHACYEEHQKEVDEELEYCRDCGQQKPMKDMIEWRWYDFYAPQGDEPRIVCNACTKLPKHQQRVERDKRNREYDLGY